MQSCSGCTLCSFYRFHIEFSCNGEPGTKSYAGWIKFGRVIGGRGFTKKDVSTQVTTSESVVEVDDYQYPS